MPEISVLLTFALACLVLTATPGPDMALVASRSAAHGRSAGFASLVGIQLGTNAHALATGFGVTQVLTHLPLAYEVLRWMGVAYMLWLAVQTLRRAGRAKPAGADAPPGEAVSACLRQGFLTNVLNPKMALFVLALFPQFFDPGGASLVLQSLLLATILNGIGLVVNGIVIVSADRLAGFARGRYRARHVADWLLGGLFLALAARLALAPR